MYTQTEINSFDQQIWRSERQKLYRRINDFCDSNQIDFVPGLTPTCDIKNAKQDHIVYMLTFDLIPSVEYWNDINHWCKENGRRVWVITDNIIPDYHFELVDFFSYPTLLGVTASYTDFEQPNPNPGRLYNCFMQRADSVRQSWFYFLYIRQLLDRGYVSFLLNQLKDYSELTGQDLFEFTHTKFGLNNLVHFDQAYHKLKDLVPYRNFVESENLLPLIWDSKYSLVLETVGTDDYTDAWMFTEKSLRAIQFPNIPLLFIKKGSIGILKSLGFELYPDLEYIDNLGWHERQQKLLEILEHDSVDFDHQALYNQSMHNRSLLRSWKNEYQRPEFFDEFYTKVLTH